MSKGIMGNKHDGKTLAPGTFRSSEVPLFNEVEIVGNSDAKILAKSFDELSKGGLTKKERETIEQFDEILKDVDIVINQAGTAATIVQEDGKTFNLNVSKGKIR